MNEEKLRELVERWDKEEYIKQSKKLPKNPEEQKILKDKEDLHQRSLDEIWFLSKHFFNEYELNRSGDFGNIFLLWLDQFKGYILNGESKKRGKPLNLETRYAFLAATKIIFLSRLQMLALVKEIWEAIKTELLKLASEAEGYSILDIMFNEQLITKQFDISAFVPLSDSSHFMEFRHLLPEGAHETVTIPCMDRLILPAELRKQNYVRSINEMYKDKKNIFIIEDFSGSGETAFKKIEIIIKKYDFQYIYFTPLIITATSKENLSDLYKIALKNSKKFKIIPGITIGKEYSLSTYQESNICEKDLKEVLKIMSEKYFKSHFYKNECLYDEENNPTPLGYRNGGFLLVLYSNCPNNSLPMIWDDSQGWKPLFRRHERYAKGIKK